MKCQSCNRDLTGEVAFCISCTKRLNEPNELKQIGLEQLDELKSDRGLIEDLENLTTQYGQQENSFYPRLKDRLEKIKVVIKKAEKILLP